MKSIFIRSLNDSGIDSKRYLIYWAVPSVVGSALIFASLIIMLPEIFGGLLLIVLFSIAVMLIATIFISLPYLWWQNRRTKIEQEMHLFITRVGVLSTSEISRKGIFDIAMEMKEYGELAKEVNKIFVLVDTWGLSIGDACRRIAKSTPSIMFGDFLERLAYAVESGEEPKDFFANEQEIILEEYKIVYDQAADTINMVAELFVALVIVMCFIVLLMTLLPFLIDIEGHMTTFFYLVCLGFILVESLLLYVFVVNVPPERIWQDTEISTKVTKDLNYYFLGSLGTSVIIGFIVFYFLDLSYPISIAITMSPLIVSGFITKRNELVVIRRDNNFAAFIRTLGSTTETSSIAPVQALKRLRWHDFGPLTQNIEALYDRVNLRIDPVLSWKYFGAETGSDLITKFSGMFVRGLEAGGKPGKAALIISVNFMKLIGLRKKRYSIASFLSGLVIGVTVAISIVFFMATGLYEIIAALITESAVEEGQTQVQVLMNPNLAVTILTNILFTLIVIHAAITSFIPTIVSAGHKYGATVNFVIMVWIGAVFSELVPYVIKVMVG